MATQFNQSLLRGLNLLRELARIGTPIGTRELARRLNEDHTRISRLLSTLAEAGVAEQDSQRRYYPGPGFHVLAAQCLGGSPLLQTAIPILKELHERGHRMALGVLWHAEVSYLYHAAINGDFWSGLARLSSYPADKSSIGQVIETFSDCPDALTPSARQKQIRKQEYCISTDPNGDSIAVPIYWGETVIAGLAIIGQHELPESTRYDIVKTAAERLSEELDKNR